MDLDPGIVCYQHCALGRLFAFTLPKSCELCGANLSHEPLLQPPFRLPYPFVRASQAPCCVVIKPTRGDFLHDYHNHTDLHIGVTDSEGRVYEFDSEGLHMDYTASWSQCLAVAVLSGSVLIQPDPVWKEYWDFTLHTLMSQGWSEERYDDKSFNCYSFVIEFLKALRPPNICTKNLHKTAFCASFIVPHTTSAARYISVYRRLLKDKIVTVPRSKKAIIQNNLPIQQNTISTTKC